MMKIISPSASFIQFGDIPARPSLKTMDFALQEYDRFNVAFQFGVRNDDNSLVNIEDLAALRIGIANMACESIYVLPDFPSPLCYKTYIDSFGGTIRLKKITYGDVVNTYDEDLTNAQLVEVLLNDFGLTLIEEDGSYYMHECCVAKLEIVYASEGGDQVLAVSRYYDRFFATADTAMGAIINISNCYKYSVCLNDEANTIIACSNPFKRMSEPGFFTKVKYRCIEDAFDFEYNESESIYNLITLPLYTAKPQYPVKRSVYRKSNGVNVVLSAVLDKQPEIMTDWMPEFFHDCINILLSHDFIYMNENGTFVSYIADDVYKVEWENDFTDKGQGSAKLKRQIYNYRNDNCTVANDCCVPPLYTYTMDEDGVITFKIYTSIRTSLLQFRYRQGGTEEWSYAEDISNIVKPVTTFVFDTGELEYANIEFQWRQQCGSSFSNWTPIEEIGGTDCDPIVFGSLDETPDGYVGVPYHLVIPFTGTLPATLDVTTKPGWATVVLDGNNIDISGIPDEPGVDLDFIMTISNNCTTNEPVEFCVSILDSVMFIDPSNQTGDANDFSEDANLKGIPGSTVTIKITTFTNSNGGTLKVNASPVFLNNTFNVVLDGSGDGGFHILYLGNSANHSTAMLVIFTIIAVDAGAIGERDTYQTSKVYP